MTPRARRDAGAERDVDALSPAAQDHLKAIWSAVEWGGPPASTTALAVRFGTSVANVSETMKRLAAQGLVEYTPYRPVTLTPRGERHALAMVRRHRLIETFLVETLGYGWDEVHDEAERLEHAVSDTLVDRIDAALGHPAADPHGDPIPDAEGRVTLVDSLPLDALPPGPPVRVRVVRVSDADAAVLAAASDAGLEPGAEIEVRMRGDDAGEVARAEVGGGALPPGVAAAVRVSRPPTSLTRTTTDRRPAATPSPPPSRAR